MFTEDMIDKIADKVMVLQDKEDTAIPLLKKELAETEKYIDNLIDAMQMGMLTKSTKQRLDELEARKEYWDKQYSLGKARVDKTGRNSTTTYTRENVNGKSVITGKTTTYE